MNGVAIANISCVMSVFVYLYCRLNQKKRPRLRAMNFLCSTRVSDSGLLCTISLSRDVTMTRI